MSDEVNSQECAIQLARVCGRLIRNARLLAELQSYRAPPRWPFIPIRHNNGTKSKVGSGLLLEFLTTKWKIDVDRLVHSDSAEFGSLPNSQVATNLNEAIVDVDAAWHELKRLRPNANDVIEPILLKLREPPNKQKFGNVQGTTMTEAVLEFSNEAFEKYDVPSINAIRELGRLPEPKGKVVQRQICREFRPTVPEHQGEPSSQNENGRPKESSVSPEGELLKVATTNCKNSEVKAWLSEQYAIRKHGEFKILPLTYEWLSENFDDSAEDLPDDLRGYELPSEGTWRRHVGAVRKATDTQVNRSRKGREHGGSVVDESDI